MTTSLLIRKAHRYLGLSIGLQFIAWTVSGLYFTWTDIDDIHGDHMRKALPAIAANVQLASPSVAIEKLKAITPVDSVHSIQLTRLLNEPVYQIRYFAGHSGEGMHLHLHHALANASTGEPRRAVNEQEAIAIAQQQLVATATIKESHYIEKTDGHHEYREKPLPAWAITFSNPDCTVYVSAEQGTFQSIRHNQWRIFDFLWMFHTMDYEARDDFNNWLIRIFSVLGLVTVASGFVLYVVSSRTLKRFSR